MKINFRVQSLVRSGAIASGFTFEHYVDLGEIVSQKEVLGESLSVVVLDALTQRVGDVESFNWQLAEYSSPWIEVRAEAVADDNEQIEEREGD